MLRETPQSHNKVANILLISPDPQLHEQVRDALSTHNTLALRTVQANVRATDRYISEIKDVSVILINFDPAEGEEVTALRKIMEDIAYGVPVIAITEALDPKSVREILQLHVDDWIPKPVSAQSLVQAIKHALTSGRSTSKTGGATCYTFLPASGGVGTTMLAVEAAFLIARKKRSFQSTCLIDLDFQTGSIPDYLDLPPNLQFAEIGSSPDRLDPQLLEVMVSRHETNLAVLATKNHFLDPIDIDPDIVARILELASLEFETLVIDLPNAWLPLSELALLGSNKVFIVTEMTVPGIRRARELIDVIRERFDGGVETQVIVNKYDQALFGNSLTKKDAVALFNKQLAGFIPLKQKLVKEAIDRGVALYEIAKRNKIDKQLSKILFQ